MADMHFDVAVIGAGAAGMMCAHVAGQRGKRVVLIDHAEKLAEKIRISGGGRCNFTNLHAKPDNYLSANPHFCRSALARYTVRDFIELVERHGIGYHEKALGQLFCDDSAQRIIDMLRNECEDAGVNWLMPCKVDRVDTKSECYLLATNRGDITCDKLVIATGGLSIPQIGATGLGYEIAKQFGLAVTPLSAGLVPLTFQPEDFAPYAELSGISFDAVTQSGKGRFREAILLTHRGLSGPAILQVSSYWKPGSAIHLDLFPDDNAADWLLEHRRSDMLLANLLAQRLPKRFATAFAEARQLNLPVKQLNEKQLRELSAQLHDWSFKPSGTLGYKKAEVTLGGVDTNELSSKTMEAKNTPGLYFIGEVVDVTGWLGGFNFQWAWSSGYACGQSV
ncbi:NAD(P)/FAD-dependent oxidoreductase [Chitinivorax sp. B]|uniref:NAD(P)/FAD-dependent oxidoreductase n=1 Tax=Chitinivorax sp. B TaxID=2502235 RepID=UPI0010F845B6|nr:NAD(P)/FAD-dependent oxidoreductase [Chitinivorax sp. B]